MVLKLEKQEANLSTKEAHGERKASEKEGKCSSQKKEEGREIII